MTLAAAESAAPTPQIRFVFKGQAGEYFGIWIVNTLLTIVTIGIFSAWAKVRSKRYFLGSTELEGTAFEYHATGGQILKGRLIVFALITAVNVVSSLDPWLGIVFVLAFLLAMPWLINQSLRFDARMTSWRTVRFHFAGSYFGALTGLLLPSLAAVLSLGLALPWATAQAKRYVINNSSFGGARFATSGGSGLYYQRLWPYLVGIIAGPAMLALVIFLVIASVAGGQGAADARISIGFLHVVLVLFAIAPLILCQHAYAARANNLALTRTRLDDRHKLRCWISPWGWAWVVVSGQIVAILTLGLMTPWAKVRRWRYTTAGLGIVVDGSLDAFLDGMQDRSDAFGGEFGEAVGFDFGL